MNYYNIPGKTPGLCLLSAPAGDNRSARETVIELRECVHGRGVRTCRKGSESKQISWEKSDHYTISKDFTKKGARDFGPEKRKEGKWGREKRTVTGLARRAWAGKGKTWPYSKENKQVLSSKTDPGYGKDLNSKLRSLNITQQTASESFMAEKSFGIKHTLGKTTSSV